MAQTTIEDLLARLKIDIGIVNNTVYDARLTSLLNAAKGAVEKEVGEAIDINIVEDAEIIIDYARWMWLSRREPTAMPASLRWRINCRAFQRNIPGGSDS